jgi:sulfide:quinone oxidoreductase
MRRVGILGAGFGGLELATLLSEALGDDVDVVLIDKSDAFVFGYSKLDVMFGRTSFDAVRLPYSEIVKPGVRFLQETVTAIDPAARRVTTDADVHEADVLVIALWCGLRHGSDAGDRRCRERVLFECRRRAVERSPSSRAAAP